MALEFSTSKKVYDQLYGRIKIITKPSHVIMSQRRNDKKNHGRSNTTKIKSRSNKINKRLPIIPSDNSPQQHIVSQWRKYKQQPHHRNKTRFSPLIIPLGLPTESIFTRLEYLEQNGKIYI